MAGNYNRIVVVGNLTRDPEMRTIDGSGKAVTKFALAVNRRSKGGDETMFIDIVAWERLGEICNQYLKKGMSALVEGRLSIRDYTNKDGEKRRAVEIVASDMQMLDSKGRGGDGASYGGSPRPAAVATSGGLEDEAAMDDEIPF
ncbi:MAG: single-stranded DNA-binding protein [Candidatus Binataceae bacterium]